MTRSNNNLRVSHAANGDKSKSTYDALNRSVQKWVASGAAAGGQDVKFNYAYDLAGNVIQIAENYPRSTLKDRTIDNTYDSANRLLTERFATNVGRGNLDIITRTYAYDGASNRLFKQETNTPATGSATAYQTSYSYNTLNQLIAYSGGATGSPAVTLTYDANGNRIKQKVTGVSGATRYNYDYENRLLSVNDAAGASYSYDYDYRTRRVRRVEPGKTTKVVFSGGLSALELEGSTGTVEVRFMRGLDMGGGVGGLLYNLRGGDASFAYNDSRGDVVLRKNSAAATTYVGAYDTFGKRSQEWGSTIERQKANTKEEDPTGLLNEGFRYRDLETGVFITRDPLGFVDGPNLYAYVRQNPWSKFDPLGLAEEGKVAKLEIRITRVGYMPWGTIGKLEIFGNGKLVETGVTREPPVGKRGEAGRTYPISKGSDYTVNAEPGHQYGSPRKDEKGNPLGAAFRFAPQPKDQAKNQMGNVLMHCIIAGNALDKRDFPYLYDTGANSRDVVGAGCPWLGKTFTAIKGELVQGDYPAGYPYNPEGKTEYISQHIVMEGSYYMSERINELKKQYSPNQNIKVEIQESARPRDGEQVNPQRLPEELFGNQTETKPSKKRRNND